jgi:hypothetical protein
MTGRTYRSIVVVVSAKGFYLTRDYQWNKVSRYVRVARGLQRDACKRRVP